MATAEGAVRRDEQSRLLRAIVDSSQVAIVSVDGDGLVTSWNKAAEATFDLPASEALGRAFERIVPEAARAQLAGVLERALAGERGGQIEIVLEAKDQQRVYMLLSVSPLRDRAGAVSGASLIANDVGVLKMREGELARITRLYAALSQINQTIVLTKDRDGLLNGICRALVEHGRFCMAWLASHDPASHKLLPVASWGDADGYAREIDVYADDRPEGRGPTGSAFQQGKPYVCNDLVNDAKTLPWRAEYERRGFRASAAFPISENGQTTGTLNVYADEPGFFGTREVELLSEAAADVSFALDNIRREEKLDEASRVLRRQQEDLTLRDRALQALTQGIVILDARNAERIVYASPSFQRLTGYAEDELIGRSPRVLTGPDTDQEVEARIRGAIREEQAGTFELLNYRKDGGAFWNRLSISPVRDASGVTTHLVTVHTDITVERELQAQFRQAQKMEAIGQLAAGVAHDFNNVLSVILSYSKLLDSELEPADSRREYVLEMEKAGKRAAGLTQQLLAFSRKQVLRPRMIELSEIVLGVEKMLRRLVRAPVEMSVITRSRGSIHVDPGQVDQVLLNLVINASDAMPDGGKLIVETSDVELDETYAARHHGAASGPHVLLAVSDTGVGMDKATRERIFEPFFTTKDVGKGTGLGLSTVFGIVRQSNGHVTVESEPGRGTTFRVYFPIAERTRPTPPEAPPAPDTLYGTETILLVEDDPHVCATAHTVLHRYGYEVLDAQNAGEALLIVEQHVDRIDLLLTDLVMPRMNGRQLAERIQTQRPGVRVLFMSGYAGELLDDLGGPENDELLISKPLAPIELVTKVRSVLDGPT